MRKVSIILLAGIVLAIGVAGVFRLQSTADSYKAPNPSKVHVVATTYPLAEFARNIGGEYVSVTTATPPGVEPHDFEPTARQVAFMLSADVFVMNGGGVDAWADDVASEVRQRGGKVVKISDNLELYKEDEGEFDPHIWLDPHLAQDMVRYIRYAIIEVDPEHRDEYLSQTDTYLTKLLELDIAYEEGLKTCTLRDIIVSHDAFGYPGRRYTINVHSVLGLSPEEEPSAKELADLADEARTLGVKTIFFETLVSPNIAKTLAREVGAETAVLNPIEGLTTRELARGENYVSIMEDNLEALKTAMMCQ